MKLVDLSHDIVDGMTTFPGLPGPVISDFMPREASRSHYAPGTEFHIGKIDLVANTGTYVDSPFHRYAGGIDLAGFRLESIANLDGLVARVPDGMMEIEPSVIDGADPEGRAILFATGWSRNWGSDAYMTGHPFLGVDTVHALIERGVSLVGIDSLNVDGMSSGERPAHSLLLGAGIPIVEHLCNLAELPENDFRFFAVPPKVRGMGTFPVRAFAIVEE